MTYLQALSTRRTLVHRWLHTFLWRPAVYMVLLVLALAVLTSGVGPLPQQVGLLVMAEDAMDNGITSIEDIVFPSPNCGNGNPAICVSAAMGTTANEKNLDNVAGVVLWRDADIRGLAGEAVCAVVSDRDISVMGQDPSSASLKDATLGVIAFQSVSVRIHSDGGSSLPFITSTPVSNDVCMGQAGAVATPPSTAPRGDNPAVPPMADLSVRKTVDNPTPNEEFTIVYTITVVNNGPDTATNVAVFDAPPAGLTFGSWEASQGSYSGGTRTWSVGTLANGVSATLNIRASVVIGTANGVITNIAEVSASDQQDPDSQPNNWVPGEDDYGMVRITVQPKVSTGLVRPAPAVGGGVSTTPTAVTPPAPVGVPAGVVPTALPRIGGSALPVALLALVGAVLTGAGWRLRRLR